ncbi:MAG: SAM-dependent methyltransferase [Deltaproteobacteria bacterium]|nr:SAM-dependent methyltransferase [Deltaproteobacteria bacterium]
MDAFKGAFDRFYLKAALHSLSYLRGQGERSPGLDRTFLDIVQQSLKFLLQRAKEAPTQEAHEVLLGLLSSTLFLARETVRRTLDEIAGKPGQPNPMVESLNAANIELLQIATHTCSELHQLQRKDIPDHRRLAGSILTLTELIEPWQIGPMVLKMADRLGREGAIELGRRVIAAKVEPDEQFLIPEFRRREKSVMNTWSYQNESVQWRINPQDRVLDVGSGGWPFSKATHLADMFLEKTPHRFETLQRDGRPFLAMDVCDMPFRDKTWDFVFCSHVLEHLERPAAALRELMRIGRRGYIEVPTRLSDIMLNFTRLPNHHRWHGLVLKNTLVLIEWKEEERRDLGSMHFFNSLHSKYHNEFQKIFEKNWDLFYAMLTWDETVDFLIVNREGEILDRS